MNYMIHPDKISRYLLNLSHKDGGPKAKFFMRFGFDPSRPDELRDALLQHALTQPIVENYSDSISERWEISGPILTPDKRNPKVLSVWVKDSDNPPRLVTAFPAD